MGGGRGRAVTGAGFHHRLTERGEAARLIDYRQRLCIQGCCCCCCCLLHAALICWGTLSVSQPLSSFNCFLSLSFSQLPSPYFSFIPLITPSFRITPPPTIISHINIFRSEGCEPSLEDRRMMMMNGMAKQISLSLLHAPFSRFLLHSPFSFSPQLTVFDMVKTFSSSTRMFSG